LSGPAESANKQAGNVDHAERALGCCWLPAFKFGGIKVRFLKLAVFLEDAFDAAVNRDREEQAAYLICGIEKRAYCGPPMMVVQGFEGDSSLIGQQSISYYASRAVPGVNRF
jgi:hypothetical protein